MADRPSCSGADAGARAVLDRGWWGGMKRIVPLALVAALIGSAAQAADGTVKAVAPVPDPQSRSLELFGGLSVISHSTYGYAGGVYAFNRNLDRNGWLLRIAGGYGRYDYYRTAGLNQGVDFQNGTVSIGYQAFLGTVRLSGYVGADVEHHDNNDPLAEIEGTKWGVKGQGEILAPFGGVGYAYLLGTMSSVWNNYLVLGKLGYNITNAISVGPQVMALGNKRFDNLRAGPFIAIAVLPNVDLILAGGYNWDTRGNSLNDTSGGYADLHLRARF